MMQLGCLLGQPNGAQSFDIASTSLIDKVNSWNSLNAQQTSHYFQNTNVHSSIQGLRIEIYSRGSTTDAILRYEYGVNNDAYKRWFPDITTHVMKSNVFARVNNATNSGHIQLSIRGSGITARIANSTELQKYEMQHDVFSQNNATFLDIDTIFSSTGSFNLFLDDFISQIDPIEFNPEYTLIDNTNQRISRDRSLGSKLFTTRHEKEFSWSIPLRYISQSHADLLNWWHENKFLLSFTLDTSDSESTYITRLMNRDNPIQRKEKPYSDLWEGVLFLKSINPGNLDF